jgi:hypothetical protein
MTVAVCHTYVACFLRQLAATQGTSRWPVLQPLLLLRRTAGGDSSIAIGDSTHAGGMLHRAACSYPASYPPLT